MDFQGLGRSMGFQSFGRRRWIYLGLAASLLLAWLLTPLPAWLAFHVVQSIPLRHDIELGRSVAAQFQRQAVYDRGLQAMGERLLRGMRSEIPYIDEYRWEFRLLNDETVNALACPGGFVFVNRGLRRMASDDELAAVLGHEIGHILHRHSLQRMVQNRLGTILLEALLHGDGDGVNEDFGSEVAGILVRGADTLLGLSYSRANEYEADSVAWWSALNAGYPPEAAVSFFRKLGGGGGAFTTWLSTHPATQDRIAALDEKGRELQQLRRQRRPTTSEAAHFVPALVQGGSVAGGILGTLLQAVPAHVQKDLVRAGLAGLTSLLEELLGGLSEGGAASSTAGDPRVDCEDGESKISFEPVRRGRYVALGHGKCLSVDDLRGLERSGRLGTNPYTRQPFTRDQQQRIRALLR